MATTKAEVRAAMDIVFATLEVVRRAGEIPAGHLYAQLMSVPGMNEANFEKLVGCLERTRMVTHKSHVLRWIGPEIAEGK